MSRGHARERAWVHHLREQGLWAQRAPASLGIDVISASPSIEHEGCAILTFWEVKSTAAGPYSHFLPEERRAMLLQAAKAGAQAFLVHWPPRGRPRVIPPEDWPREKEKEKKDVQSL